VGKKSEVRRHAAAVRIDPAVLERAKLAASLTGVSVAEYVTALAAQAAERDIAREVRRLADGLPPSA
jgi:hypothetical protein